MSEHSTFSYLPGEFTVGSINRRIVLAAAVVGILINLTSLMVPILRIGGGVVAGFIAGYAVGRPGLGLVHAVLASGIAGVVAGMNTVLLGLVFGFYNEPPLLFLSFVGPISPMFAGLGLPSVLLIVTALTLLIVVDGVIGGLVGAGLRLLLPW